MIFCRMYPNPPGQKVTKAEAKKLMGCWANDVSTNERTLLAERLHNPGLSYIATLCLPGPKYGELTIVRRGNAFRYYHNPEA
jgi:hypothetical protein